MTTVVKEVRPMYLKHPHIVQYSLPCHPIAIVSPVHYVPNVVSTAVKLL